MENQDVETTVVQTQQPSQPAPGLSVNDLTLVLNIIQTISKRGAFLAEELTTVGGVYDRISQFLDSVGALPKHNESSVENQVE